MITHPTIDKWGRAKYNLPSDATVMIAMASRGRYQATEYYTDEIIVIYSVIDGRTTHVEDLYTDLGSILREILKFDTENQ